jgi:hypothetical protein
VAARVTALVLARGGARDSAGCARRYPASIDAFSSKFVITLHAVVFGLFAVYLVAGHHWSDAVISENRLSEVKTQLGGECGALASCRKLHGRAWPDAGAR